MILDAPLSQTPLSRDEARALCAKILNDTLDHETLSATLLELRARGETSDELLGFLDEIRATATRFPMISESLSAPLIDVCGTGGDGAQTFNVSTGVAIVLASLNRCVAKHGNRGVSSRSGSADVLQALGILGDHSSEAAAASLVSKKISFLFAPAFYPVLARIAPLRKAIGKPTLFNVLGPLLNPAPLTHQLMGVYDASFLKPAGEALKDRRLTRAWIVHGSDRLDELTLTGASEVRELNQGKFSAFSVSPGDFGLGTAHSEAVRGGDPFENARILIDIFSGIRSPKRDLVVMNAAAAFALMDASLSLKDAVKTVEQAIDSGATFRCYERLKCDQEQA